MSAGAQTVVRQLATEWISAKYASEILQVDARPLRGILETKPYRTPGVGGRASLLLRREDIELVAKLRGISGIAVERAGMIVRALRAGKLKL